MNYWMKKKWPQMHLNDINLFNYYFYHFFVNTYPVISMNTPEKIKIY